MFDRRGRSLDLPRPRRSDVLASRKQVLQHPLFNGAAALHAITAGAGVQASAFSEDPVVTGLTRWRRHAAPGRAPA